MSFAPGGPASEPPAARGDRQSALYSPGRYSLPTVLLPTPAWRGLGRYSLPSELAPALGGEVRGGRRSPCPPTAPSAERGESTRFPQRAHPASSGGPATDSEVRSGRWWRATAPVAPARGRSSGPSPPRSASYSRGVCRATRRRCRTPRWCDRHWLLADLGDRGERASPPRGSSVPLP